MKRKNPTIISQPFVLEGKPVRLVEWDWRKDKEYKNDPSVEESLQVTWGDYPDPLRGWVGNVDLVNGTWYSGDDRRIGYASADQAAFDLVTRYIQWKRKLSDKDVEKLMRMYTSSLLPGIKPVHNPSKSYKRLLK